MRCRDEYDAIIVGGGFYGCLLAIQLRKSGAARVLLMERESSILQRASYANQARVHNGYHYPRSFLTALRSRVNFPRFVADYKECIDDTFDQYYAISKVFSNITAGQFHTFCTRIGAPVEPALPEIRDLFNQELIEQVFRVREAAFDAVKLRQRVNRDLEEYDVAISFDTEVLRVLATTGSRIEVVSLCGGAEARTIAGQVVNAIIRIKDRMRSLRIYAAYVGFPNATFDYEPMSRRGASRNRTFLESVRLAVGTVVANSTHPLRVVSVMGIVISGLNGLYAGYVLLAKFFADEIAAGWAGLSLQSAAMFFFLFLALAVLCEYVGRILGESGDRPLYYVLEEKKSSVLLDEDARKNVVTESV